MALQVNMEKSKAALQMCLQKKAPGLTPPVIDIIVAMDVSGSFEDEHRSGMTNDLMTRLVPWGMVFDPDKQIDFYTFSNGYNVTNVGPVTLNNYEGYIQKNVIKKVLGWNGGTDYAPVLEKIVDERGLLPKKAGFLERLVGKKSTEPSKKPIFVWFVTDGENNDEDATRELLSSLAERKVPIYVQFIGVGNGSERELKRKFAFIEQLGEEFDNTGFTPILHLNKFLEQTDEELNETVISEELIKWISSVK